MDVTADNEATTLRAAYGAGAWDQAMVRCLAAGRRGDRIALARWRAVLERLAETCAAANDRAPIS